MGSLSQTQIVTICICNSFFSDFKECGKVFWIRLSTLKCHENLTLRDIVMIRGAGTVSATSCLSPFQWTNFHGLATQQLQGVPSVLKIFCIAPLGISHVSG